MQRLMLALLFLATVSLATVSLAACFESGGLNTGGPGPRQPDTGQPDTGHPDAALPDSGQPDAALPDTGHPDAALPDSGQPDTGHPADVADSADVGAGEPDAAYDDIDAAHPDPDPDPGPDPDPDPDPDPPPVFETIFTRPQPGQTDRRIEDVTIELLRSVPAGASVRAAYYTFSRTRIAEAFGDAHDRGVDVRVVLGNTNRHADGRDWSAVEILKQRLGSRLKICREGQSSGGCIGDRINHNKFILVSELGDGSKNVVMQSSANFTNPQLSEFNNLVIIRDDAALYRAYSGYWTDLERAQQNLNYYRLADGDHRTRVYFFPRQSGDTIVSILNNTDCSNGAKIHIAMAFFSNVREPIAERLAQMDRQGCRVHVIVRESASDHSPGARIVSTLRTGNIDLAYFPEGSDVTLHSKYLLIEGEYGTNRTYQRLVWTGSHNYTGPALTRNDETLLKIRNDAVHAAFLADWQHIRSRATRM